MEHHSVILEPTTSLQTQCLAVLSCSLAHKVLCLAPAHMGIKLYGVKRMVIGTSAVYNVLVSNLSLPCVYQTIYMYVKQ